MVLKSALASSLFLALLITGQITHAGYKEDMGFTELQAELGGSMPNGSGIHATQVEARTSYNPDGPFMPNTADPQFSGKTLTKKTSDGVSGSSDHATSVGRLFYGNASSLSPGITHIDCYEVIHFLSSGFLHHGYSYQPGYSFSSSDKSSPSRVANHSWVGGTDPISDSSDILRRLDFLIETDEFIQVVAPDNASSGKPLLISAFNSISVGRSDGSHQRGSVAVDAVYAAGRVKPDVVVPYTPTSYSAPLGASAAALLVQTGKAAALSTDPVQQYTTNRDGTQIRNAERPEVVKAALMAGALRCPVTSGVTDYRVAPENQSANGLDKRFGAGQVNVYHSYRIIAAGEQNSAEDYPAGQGNIGVYGFDFDPFFGGNDASNTTASYSFTADQSHRMLYASLVWNIAIHGGTWNDFNNAASLYNLDLFLHDVTDSQNPRLLASSTGSGDNTENLWVPLAPGRKYRLQVTRQGAFKWDYALAWRMETPPDSDGDNLPDDWEVYYGFSHLDAGNALLDADGDGLTNAQEYTYGTDAKNSDSDNDGYADGFEVSSGSNPLDPQSIPQPFAVPALGAPAFPLCALLLLGLGLKARAAAQEKTKPKDHLPHIFS